MIRFKHRIATSLKLVRWPDLIWMLALAIVASALSTPLQRFSALKAREDVSFAVSPLPVFSQVLVRKEPQTAASVALIHFVRDVPTVQVCGRRRGMSENYVRSADAAAFATLNGSQALVRCERNSGGRDTLALLTGIQLDTSIPRIAVSRGITRVAVDSAGRALLSFRGDTAGTDVLVSMVLKK
jgi:hypothetical protein